MNCDRSNEDPNILYPTELKKNNLSGVICRPKSARGVMRLGYMRHWGVARDDRDYYRQWIKTFGKHFHPIKKRNKDIYVHYILIQFLSSCLIDEGDTTNSVVNLLNSVEEFKQRSDADDEVVFILLSNLWDNHRYVL